MRSAPRCATSSETDSRALGHGMHVLVAASREVDEQDRIPRHAPGDAHGIRNRVRRLERGDDALAAAQLMERSQRLVVGHREVFGAAAVLEPGMLGSDARVIEPRGNRVRLGDLAVRVLKQVGAVAVQHARLSSAQRRGVSSGGQALARGLDADELYFFILYVPVETY